MGTHPIFESDFDCLTEMAPITLKFANSTCEIYHHGATVTSWKVDGKEKLFLSSKAVLDGSKAIRGGIPVVFPNFGPWELGPQHGFARILPWNVAHQTESSVTLSLEPCKKTREMWDFSFKLEYTVRIDESSLYTIMTVENTDQKAFDFTALLHTYLHVDIKTMRVNGFQQEKCTNSLTGEDFVETSSQKTIDAIVDQIYKNVSKEQIVESSLGKVKVSRKGLPDVVFWNPWTEKAKAMSDFNDDGYKNMVCVEPGYVAERKVLQPCEKWTGSQWLSVL